METHDGFTAQEWKELARFAIEQGAFPAERLNKSRVSPAMSRHLEHLRHRALKKFSDPDRWLWTTKLLEQASDEKVSNLMATGFPVDVPVIDFCCGAGADAVAIARRGRLLAVDRCEVACALTEANLAMHFADSAHTVPAMGKTSVSSNSEFKVVQADAQEISIPTDAWVHIDPDRRAHARRTIQVDQFQPSFDFLVSAIEKSAGGSIKLAPATKLEMSGVRLVDPRSMAIDRIFERVGRQFVAWGGSVRQQRWWWNVPLYSPGSTTVSVLGRSGEWHHWSATRQEVAGCDGWSHTLDDWQAIQGFVGDADGCVRAAGLQGLLAEKLKASIIGNPFGFFQKNQLDDLSSPMIDWFEVIATIAFDRKRLRSYLRDRNIGTLEIKVRNIEIDPELLRREMKLHGSEVATVLVTRCGTKTVAIIARRLLSQGSLPAPDAIANSS